jgi:hypothetical protein
VTAAAGLVLLRRKVDEHFEAARARSPQAVRCASGCHACCRPGLSVFAVEAAPIREALRALAESDPAARARVRAAAASFGRDRCVLLLDERCVVYEQRPIMCRTHGLPLRARIGGEVVVDHCQLNYQGVSPPAASIVDLERVDAPLAVLATMEGADLRITLDALAAADDG